MRNEKNYKNVYIIHKNYNEENIIMRGHISSIVGK